METSKNQNAESWRDLIPTGTPCVRVQSLYKMYRLASLWGTEAFEDYPSVDREIFCNFVDQQNLCMAVEYLKCLCLAHGVELPSAVITEQIRSDLVPGKPLPLHDRLRLASLAKQLWESVIRAEVSEAIGERPRQAPDSIQNGLQQFCPPTIWHHAPEQYSTDGKTPMKVSPEHDNILTAFLDRELAMDTKQLEVRSGCTNVSRAIKALKKACGGIFSGAIRTPAGGRRGTGGYYIRVRRVNS